MIVRTIVVTALAFSFSALLPAPAMAAGCLKGAAVGGVAGHMAGKHGTAGAATGCAIGHHEASKKQKAASDAATASTPPSK
jgi:hypothetical protein